MTTEPRPQPADELRAAAFQLRNPFHLPGLKVGIDSDLAAALADWLDAEARGIEFVTHLAELHDGHIQVSVETAPDGRPCYAYSAHQHALAVARLINAPQ